MPFQNEHACRLRDPGDFKKESFRRTKRKSDGKEYSIIMGKLKGEDSMTEQAYRYGKDVWSSGDARKHCKDHKGKTFEPAQEADGVCFVNDSIEVRMLPVELELREEGEGKNRTFVGMAAVFDKKSEDLGGFREIIRKGTFKKTLKEADIHALKNHDMNLVLGRNKAGTLRLRETKEGLQVEIDPPNTTYANDLAESVDRGDITQMSFMFRKIRDNWVEEEGELPLRELLEVKLYDVSIVTKPAYPDTSVALREYRQLCEQRLTDEIQIESVGTGKLRLDLAKKTLDIIE
jgi:HK97 family phage prohead protease